MTRMHLTECKSHSVVNDTNAFGQWHECSETGFFAPPYRTVNDTNKFGQWHECRSLSVNHTQSITQMQIAKCNIHSALIPECDLDSAKFSWVWFTLSAFLSLTMSLTAFKLCKAIYPKTPIYSINQWSLLATIRIEKSLFLVRELNATQKVSLNFCGMFNEWWMVSNLGLEHLIVI